MRVFKSFAVSAVLLSIVQFGSVAPSSAHTVSLGTSTTAQVVTSPARSTPISHPTTLRPHTSGDSLTLTDDTSSSWAVGDQVSVNPSVASGTTFNGGFIYRCTANTPAVPQTSNLCTAVAYLAGYSGGSAYTVQSADVGKYLVASGAEYTTATSTWAPLVSNYSAVATTGVTICPATVICNPVITYPDWGHVLLSWTAPAGYSSANISGYTVSSYDSGVTTPVCTLTGSSSTSCTIPFASLQSGNFFKAIQIVANLTGGGSTSVVTMTLSTAQLPTLVGHVSANGFIMVPFVSGIGRGLLPYTTQTVINGKTCTITWTPNADGVNPILQGSNDCSSINNPATTLFVDQATSGWLQPNTTYPVTGSSTVYVAYSVAYPVSGGPPTAYHGLNNLLSQSTIDLAFSVKTLASAPTAPSNVTATDNGDGTFALNWTGNGQTPGSAFSYSGMGLDASGNLIDTCKFDQTTFTSYTNVSGDNWTCTMTKAYGVTSNAPVTRWVVQIISNQSAQIVASTAPTLAQSYMTAYNWNLWGSGQTGWTSIQNSTWADSLGASSTPQAPGAPTGVTATSNQNTQSVVSWTAPASNGGSAITGYTVTSTPGSKTCTTTGATTCTVTGLTNGTAYTFTVTATNVNGTSNASVASSSATPSTTPGAPTSVTATAGNAQATVSWTAPANNGGASVTSYTVTSSPGNKTCTTATTSCTVTGLTNATAYTFTVTATNPSGTSAASTASTAVTPFTVPGAPTGVSATAGSAQATVSWTAPSATNGSAITGYTVTSSPGGLTCTTTTLSCVVTGLTGGVAYTFTVVATNAAGNSAASSASSSATPTGVAQPPTNLTATFGSTQVVLTWTAPTNNGGLSITKYVVTASPSGKSCNTTGALTCTITGLTNGTQYTFTAIAQNSAGNSAASNTATATPAMAPSLPTGVSATVGNAQSVVSWTAPSSTGGAAISAYTVTSSPGGKTCTTTGTSCTVTGLTNGTSYTFTVVATNVAGSSPASGASSAVIPKTTPDAPTGVTVTPAIGGVTVAWTAPSNGGANITGYTVTATPGGATCTTFSATTCVVANLTPGTSYTFTVTATNSVGTSSSSATSSSAVPQGVPGAPTNVSGTPSSSQVLVNWSAPANTGGLTITKYVVTASPSGKSCSTTGATSCAVTGLTNGTAYTFSVVAQNAAGNSAASTSITSTPADKPSLVTRITATSHENGQSTVAWTAPSSNGGAAITGYTVTSTPGNKTCTTTTALTCVVTGLTNGTAYTFTVVATNVIGNSVNAVSSSATPMTTPGAPTVTTAVPGNGQVTVSWSAPSSNGGSTITAYVVSVSPGTATCRVSGATTCIVTGLTNGTSYSVTVVATNVIGNSSSSNSVSATPATKPTAPSGATGQNNSGVVTVTWNAPSADGGSSVTSYTVTASPGGATCTASATTCDFTTLTLGFAYTFKVTATNAVGTSLASAASSAVIPKTVPNAPASVTETDQNGSVFVKWTVPTSNGGSVITGYTATAEPGGAFCTTTTAIKCTITGLSNGTSYQICVQATNSEGTGNCTWAGTTAIPYYFPDAPTGVTLSSGRGGFITANWTAGFNEGRSVTQYVAKLINFRGHVDATCTVTTTSCTFNNLPTQWTYTVTVTEYNLKGASAVSTPSAGQMVGMAEWSCVNPNYLLDVNGSIEYSADLSTWTNLGGYGGVVNAIGYDSVTHYLYGVSQGQSLIQYGYGGAAKNLGPITGLAPGEYLSGDVDSSTGIFYVSLGKVDSPIYAVNLSTRQATLLNTGGIAVGQDFTVMNGWLVTVSHNSVNGVNLSNLSQTFSYPFGIPNTSYPATWTDSTGVNLYFMDHSGQIWEVSNLFDSSQMRGDITAMKVNGILASSITDGANCLS